jgi:hypothetical protein
MGGCYIFGFNNATLTYTYFCELNNKVYNNISDCVNNCVLTISDKIVLYNASFFEIFLIYFFIVLILSLGLLYVILDW